VAACRAISFSISEIIPHIIALECASLPDILTRDPVFQK